MMDLSHLVVSIDSHRNGEMVIIRPRIDNPTPLTLQYRLTVQKRSASGQSSSSQQGDFQTGTAMASVSVNLPADATCQVNLQVLQQNTVIREIESACDGTAAEGPKSGS
ncbi:MAG: curli-like amyloid fiber formation chaperone CsgH [Formivibrio sp.]|nr:curli-like amyloid fiber formation chaperone CsgH [Formivibrio sp.]